MKGWKTKAGFYAGLIGGAMLGGAEVAPTPQIGVWMRFIGIILVSFGGGTMGYGIAHKIEKTK